MQNKSILTTLAPSGSSTAAKPRAPENKAPDQQFTHMLTRQMNERVAPKPATKPADAPKPAAAKAPEATKKTDDSAPANAPASPGTPASEPAPVAEKKADESKDKPDTSASALPATSTDAALSASAAIMALVANAGAAVAATPAAAAATTAKVNLDPATLAGSARLDPRAVPDGGPADAVVKELAAKGAGEFANALQSATTAKPDQDIVLARLVEQPVAGNALQPMQQTALTMAAPAGVHPGNSLAPQVNNSAWDQALGQRMVWMVAGAEQSATLTLNPPDLGPLQVVLNVTNGQADASFFAAQPEVRQALEAAMPKLREMLGDAGISLGQANVSSGSPNPHGGSGQGDNGARRSTPAGAAGSTSVSARRITSSGNGMVDTFA
jgi:flagellar hook-length control protein FliK